MSRSPRSSRRFSFAALAAAAMLVLSACGGGDGTSSSDGSGNSSGFQTLTDGKLTIATGEPAFSPWVENNKPESGEGFETAVAYAVAEELGFEDDDVVWVRTPFDTVIAPGPKNFDVNIQQFSITPERQEAVDFSSPYYVTSQGVLTVEGTAAADAKSLADLKDVKFGVAAGSNSAKIIEDQVAPAQEIGVFNSNDDAIAALTAGQIDAVVTDLPTVLYMAAAVLDGGIVVGQFDTSEGGDEYAFLLPKDSPLTSAVSGAVDTLREDGTLDELAQEWLADNAGAPVLK